MGQYQGVKNGSVQTDYTDQPFEGFPGQIATRDDDYLIDGYPAQENVAVGIGVVKGDLITATAGEYSNIEAPYKVRTPIGASVEADFVGITVRANGSENDVNGNPFWGAERMTPVMRVQKRGRIMVQANVAVAAEDPVWMIVADNGGHGYQIGSFVNADLGNADTIQLTELRYWKPAEAGAVAIIEAV